MSWSTALSWRGVTVILCLYGFFKELRPSEAWLTRYLKEDKNLTENQVDNEVYVILTYSYMAALVVVLITTDILQHTPIIAFEGVAYIGTWALLIWGEGVQQMQLMQFVYGWATSTEIAYYSYVYLIVTDEKYQRVTSYTRSIVLFGRFLSGVFAQVFVSFNILNYLQLNYFSMASVCVAMSFSIALLIIKGPRRARRTRTTLLEPPRESTESTDVQEQPTIGTADSFELIPQERWTCHCCPCGRRFLRIIAFEAKEMVCDLKQCYSNMGLLKWSIWWALASCGFMQVGNYGQNLWDEIMIDRPDRKLYNGAVEAISTLAGAIMAFSVGFIKVDWKEYGELLLFIVSFADGICLMFMAQATNLFFCYALYIIFRALYHLVITVASFQIATYLTTDRYGLIFGFNTFIALVLESIITVIVVDKRGLNTPVRQQFMVYSGYFIAIGLIFMVAVIYSIRKKWLRTARLNSDIIETSY